jgi:methylenetetrahydrofolate dehydrogenase (NADP+)/methenyltetrahydrofolate cyclohydrolase
MTETIATADERTPGGAILMDGVRLRDEITEQLAAEMLALGSPMVCLGTVLVGDDRPSQIYVRSKHRQAEKAGMTSQHIGLPPTASQIEVEDAVAALAADPDVHGILVQLPLPKGLDPDAVVEAIPPGKDADGLHPVSQGRLMAGVPGLRPCTPLGVMRLLDEVGVELKGARAVVVGRSVLVGKPMAFLLLDGKHLLGVGRLAADPGFEQAEFALVVASDRQRHGYGELLLRHVLAYAKTRGIQRVIGHVLRENRKMLHLAERLGFKREGGAAGGADLKVVKFLGEL